MDIRLILHLDQFMPYVSILKEKKVIAISIKTTGADPHCNKLRLIVLKADDMSVLIIDCFSFLPDGLVLLKDLFASNFVAVFHDADISLQFLMAIGIKPYPIFDVMLAAQLLRSSGAPKRPNLKNLARHYLNEHIDKEDEDYIWSDSLDHRQIENFARDTDIILRLRKIMVKFIVENELTTIAQIEFSCVRAIANIEYSGILLNREKWKLLTTLTEKKRDEALESLYLFAGPPIIQSTLWGSDKIYDHNFDSNPYVLELLNSNDIPVYATSKANIYPYRRHPLVRALSAYRKASKSLSTFLYPYRKMINHKTGRLHSRYRQICAWSGRMSCDSPNIQQIPRDASFRKCFIPANGNKLIIADYPQIELRVAAQIASDERMLSAFQNGDDLHLLTASFILNKSIEQIDKQERQAAKAVNFGLIFGMGASGLQQYAQQSYGTKMTLEQAEMFCKRFFDAYRGIDRWHSSLKYSPPKGGRTLTGRKFLFPKNAGIPVLTNAPVQGTAADITKKALGLLYERLLSTNANIVAVVHDEIILESTESDADKVAAILTSTMEEAANSILPLAPSYVTSVICDNWAEK